MVSRRLRFSFSVGLVTASFACTSPSTIVGEWLVASRDSVHMTVEFLADGTVRMHQYYVGHDTARREVVRRADSVTQARQAETSTFWTIRGDSVCVLGASDLGAPECGVYRIRDDGLAPVLQVGDEPPWSRYRAGQ
jgi:hypothetical protein